MSRTKWLALTTLRFAKLWMTLAISVRLRCTDGGGSPASKSGYKNQVISSSITTRRQYLGKDQIGVGEESQVQ